MAGTRILLFVLVNLLYCVAAKKAVVAQDESDVNACVNNPCGVNATCVDLPNPAPNNTTGRNCTCPPATPVGDPQVLCYACDANAHLENYTHGDRGWDYWGRRGGRSVRNRVTSLRCVCNSGFIGNGTSCKAIDACMRHPCAGCANCTLAPNATYGRVCNCTCGVYSERSGCSRVRPSVNLTKTTISSTTPAPVQTGSRGRSLPQKQSQVQLIFTATINGTCVAHPSGSCIFEFRQMTTRRVPVVNGTCTYQVTSQDCPDQTARVQYSGDNNYQAITTQIGQSSGRY